VKDFVVIVTANGQATVETRVQAKGRARLNAEAARIASVKARGAVPAACGDAIPEAPARGTFRMFEPLAHFPAGAAGDYVAKPAGYRGRKALQRADVFDVMAARASSNARPAPFSRSQVATGRYYRDLVERHASAGLQSSSIEAHRVGGSGQGGCFMDAVLRDREEIDRLCRRIGTGSAMVVRRIRPSKRGARVTIADRRLVDMVCLEDRSISEVLRAHGWSVKGDTVRPLQQALAQALDRMAPVGRG